MAVRVAFEEFILDLDTRELLRGGTPVALSPKAFHLLGLLVEHRPKALSKSDLQERLWPGTFVVDKNLTNLVAEIRGALGDDASDPRFVRTVHRFGYAFQAPPAATRAGEPRPARTRARFRLVWAGGRTALTDGDHVIGRDPDVELFLDSASRATMPASRSPGTRRPSRIWAARTERLSGSGASGRRRGSPMATSFAWGPRS